MLDEFVQMRPTPIEQKSMEVHKCGMKTIEKLLEKIRKWIL